MSLAARVPCLTEQRTRKRSLRAVPALTADAPLAAECCERMASILIDKLLQTVVNRNASDFTSPSANRRSFAHDGHLMRLETKVLTPEDTTVVDEEHFARAMPAGVAGGGRHRLRLRVRRQGRFRVSIFKQKGNVAMVLRQIPAQADELQGPGHAAGVGRLVRRPRGLILVTGPTGSGKTTTLAAMIDYINQTFRPSHHHDRRPDRVLSHAQEVDGQSARSRRRRADVRRGHSPRLAAGPGRDPGRRNAQPGDDRGGDHGRRNGHIVFGTLHTTSARHGQSNHRRVSHQSAGADSHPAFHGDHRDRFADAAAEDGGGPWRPTKCSWSTPLSPT